ncbi:hypothetical protein EQH57_1139 [Dictyocoela roeselum]|nr:hypothetical protein EQH57_1139 [Dictyocoela roeselum]
MDRFLFFINHYHLLRIHFFFAYLLLLIIKILQLIRISVQEVFDGIPEIIINRTYLAFHVLDHVCKQRESCADRFWRPIVHRDGYIYEFKVVVGIDERDARRIDIACLEDSLLVGKRVAGDNQTRLLAALDLVVGEATWNKPSGDRCCTDKLAKLENGFSAERFGRDDENRRRMVRRNKPGGYV